MSKEALWQAACARTVSSATAHVGETVDFEVSEPVISQSYAVIPKGAVALGRETKVEPKRRFGRAGALELSIDSARLPDGRTIPLRATPEKGEGDMSGARVAAKEAPRRLTSTPVRKNLIQLKEVGVSDNVINAMVQKSVRR
jgi:hypothetical protein